LVVLSFFILTKTNNVLFVADDILFDFSKNRITDETIHLLLALAEQQNVRQKIDEMFEGEIINFTEKR
jgi:glucose-6-phosphate isomerase